MNVLPALPAVPSQSGDPVGPGSAVAPVWFSDAEQDEPPFFCQVCWAYGGLIVRHASKPRLVPQQTTRDDQQLTTGDLQPLQSAARAA